jgi:uncharacterized protein (TIGR02646 family)
MIRVHKPAAPAVLSGRGVTEARKLCAAHDSSPGDYRTGKRKFRLKRSIYAHQTVKAALLEAQHHKCAFCESRVTHIAYGDVEHYRPKAGYQQREGDALRRPGYYWLAYSWDNLLFVCQLCNQERKGNLFPLRRPRARARSHSDNLNAEEPLLIDPSRLDPSDYIRFRDQYAVPVRNRREGKTTIDVLGLNREKLAEARAERLQSLRVLHDLCKHLRREIARSPSPELAERLRQHEASLWAHADDQAQYAAMARAYLGTI